jgi:aspartyl protease
MRLTSLIGVPILLSLAVPISAGANSTIDQLSVRLPVNHTQALERWLAGHRDAPAEQRGRAYGALCKAEQRAGRYRAAAEACRREVEAQGRHPDPGTVQAFEFLDALADVPPIHVEGVVDSPLTYGWTGMAEVQVEIDGQTSSWGVDTGAEVAVMSESDAALMHVRMLNRSAKVHGSTPGTAGGRLGVIDKMHVGGARIDNVPVFVQPDATLTFDGHRVPPLFSVAIMYAFGRTEFADHGKRLRLMPARAKPLSGLLSWNESGVAIELGVGRGRVRAHLDTGANVSELNFSTLSLLSAHQRSRLTATSDRLAGVSGEVERRRVHASSMEIALGNDKCRLQRMNFGSETGGVQGRVGIDLVKSCSDFMFDVSTMTFSARGD